MWVQVVAAVGALAGAACGPGVAPDPFARSEAGPADADPPEAGSDAGGAGPVGSDAGRAPPDAGDPCARDPDCDDSLDCTVDRCASGRCERTVRDALCDDGVFCNGAERCEAGRGCVPGEPLACSDGTACTIDVCIEATRRCEHRPRDADGDGDPDVNCPGGGDCDEREPRISSRAAEVCDNGRDDDCDGTVDEAEGCARPRHDTCEDPLVISAPGRFLLPLAAARLDFAASCAEVGPRWVDLVATLRVPDGPSVDVDVLLVSSGADVALVASDGCGGVERACAGPAEAPRRGRVARLRLRDTPPGDHAITLLAEGSGTVELAVDFFPVEPPPLNETCGTAAPLRPGEPVTADLVGVGRDLDSRCDGSVGELVYAFELAVPSDVTLLAAARDPWGAPRLSLRGPDCADAGAEITCRAGDAPRLFHRALPAGRHLVALGATGPSRVELSLEVEPAAPRPPGEDCAAPLPLRPGEVVPLDLGARGDDVASGCLAGAPEVALALELPAASDVLLIEGLSGGTDQGAVALLGASCDPDVAPLACETGAATPVRALARGVAPGSYRVLAESAIGSTVSVAALLRPAGDGLLVPFADGCDEVVLLPPGGAHLEGNTSNLTDDLDASCDTGGGASSPDQLLALELTEPRRVVLDSRGSAYATVLDLREGPTCPGVEVPGACSAGSSAGRSFVDRVLAPGRYFVQIDGVAGDAGAWTLEVFVVEP